MGRATGSLFGIIIYALLTRILPPELVGGYFLAFSIASTLALVVTLGLPKTVIRLVAESLATNKSDLARHTIIIAFFLFLLAAITVTIIFNVALGSFLSEQVFKSKILAEIIPLISIWIVLIALRTMLAETFRGLSNLKLASIFGGPISNLVTASTLFLIWLNLGSSSISHAIEITLLGLFVSASIACFLLIKHIKTFKSGATTKVKTLMLIALPLLLTALFQHLISQSNIWVLGYFKSDSDVALYGPVLQIVLLVSLPFIIVNNTVLPLIAKYNVTSRHAELEKILRTVATLTSIPAIIVVVIVSIFGESLLAFMYGDYYKQSATALLWLACGQLVNVSCGSCSVTLMLCGHQNKVMLVTGMTGIIAIILAILLVDTYGVTGVAASAAIATSLQNIIMLFQVKRNIGIWTHTSFSASIFKQLKTGFPFKHGN